MSARALGIVVTFELRRLLVGPRGVLIVLALLLSLVPGFWVRWLAEELNELKADAVGAPTLGPIYDAVAWLTNLPAEEIATLFHDHPPHLLAFFALWLWFIPILTYITGFDQTATDIRERHLRYLLLRVDRGTLLLGRALATLLVLSVGYAFGIGVMMWLLSGVEGGLGGASGVLYLLRVWVFFILFTIPFVALLAWTNTLTGHPYLAFAVAVGLHFGLWVIGWVGELQEIAIVDQAHLLFPTAYKFHLLSDEGGRIVTAVAHQMGLAAVFAALGWRSFRRRDL